MISTGAVASVDHERLAAERKEAEDRNRHRWGAGDGQIAAGRGAAACALGRACSGAALLQWPPITLACEHFSRDLMPTCFVLKLVLMMNDCLLQAAHSPAPRLG